MQFLNKFFVYMNFHTKGLLTLLISLFLLASCENPTGVGLDVDPEEQIMGSKTDTVSIRTVTLRDDSSRYQYLNQSRNGDQFAQTVFGALYDPVIGNSVVNMAVDLLRPSSVPRIKSDATIDSAVLVLPYGLDYFGDTLRQSTFTIEVRQLSEDFVYNTHTARTWTSMPDVIGSRTLSRFAYQDSVSVMKYVEDKDSLVRSIPQLRIPLSGDFFKDLLHESVDSASLSTEVGFRNRVKGLYISINESGAPTGPGGLVTFAAVTDLSGVELTYRQPNGLEGDEAGIDTVRTLLAIPAQSSTTGRSMGMVSSVNYSYSAAVTEQLSDPNGNFETLYLQAPAGLRAKVSFPYIDDLKGRNIVINKAELIVYADDSDATFGYQAPRIGLYREDIAGQRQPVPDGDMRQSSDPRSLGPNFGGYYDQDKKRYVFYLTSFVQDVLEGKINNPEVFIAPVSPFDQTNPFVSVANTGSRAVIGGGSHAAYTMKLNLYYTEIQ